MRLVVAVLLSLFSFELAASDLHAKGRLLVGVAGEDAKALALHGRVTRLGKLDVYALDLPNNVSERAVAALLARHPHIRFAEFDRLIPPAVDDPGFSAQWHLPAMQVPAAWGYSLGSNILVAVLDTGVEPTHPDLQGKLVPGWNFWDGNSDTSDVYPFYGHGTPVAGVVAAACNNALGVASVACGAMILPVRVSTPDGWAFISVIAQGLVWAADQGARVANISYVVNGDTTIQAATQYFRGRGGVVVSSAGNDGRFSFMPDDELITVAATDSADARAAWSSYGPYVDLSAPGVDILSTIRGGAYWSLSGTSFSAPMVSGVIALMLSANPWLAPDTVEIILRATAVDLGAPGYDQLYGHGRVNAAEAVQASVRRYYPMLPTKPKRPSFGP